MKFVKNNKVKPENSCDCYIIVEDGDGDETLARYDWNAKTQRFEEINEEYMLSCHYTIDEVIAWCEEIDLMEFMKEKANES